MINTKVYYHKTEKSEQAIDYVREHFRPKGQAGGAWVKKTFATADLLGFVHSFLLNNPDRINEFLDYMNLERKNERD